MYRWSFPALLLLFPALLSAQDVLHIADPAAILPSVDLGKEAGAKTCLKEAGLDDAVADEVLLLGSSTNWPAGLRTDSARTANAGAIRNYNVRRVCEHTTDAGAISIVAVRALDNLHMPEDLRSRTDVYMLVRSEGLKVAETAAQRPAPSRGPSWRALPTARILTPDALFATYDLSADTAAMAVLHANGLSQPEIEAVIFRSHERNWPEGMDSFNERYPRLAELKGYKARLLAKWDDKVVLVVPAELNRKAPVGLRPYMDIYLVYAATAVEVRTKRR
jgi:hypothetical protein